MSAIIPVIFGEVLYDCFPDGAKHLGGAPFNVAWHLQAFGDEPLFISSVGYDENGREIIESMRQWGMNGEGVQISPYFATGQVNVSFNDGEPSYEIAHDRAYDYIYNEGLPDFSDAALLYHGTLALRQEASRQTLDKVLSQYELPVFLDVNLREPWWQKQQVSEWLQRARWVKLNQHELAELAPAGSDPQQRMEALQQQSDIELLVVTQGEQGVVARHQTGESWQVEPAAATEVVDTVGAGDAFSARLIHGLLHNEEIDVMLGAAQEFASRIVGLRGAVPASMDFYEE